MGPNRTCRKPAFRALGFFTDLVHYGGPEKFLTLLLAFPWDPA
jgi:hypothetical protein